MKVEMSVQVIKFECVDNEYSDQLKGLQLLKYEDNNINNIFK